MMKTLGKVDAKGCQMQEDRELQAKEVARERPTHEEEQSSSELDKHHQTLSVST
ncbi:hypothetical protein [Gracilibacillus salinarum]|uniref:YpzI family protein n=1 Tax=Gracilibacillus salinarum TaxID=2932255 RepID=A0ABY4GPU7_9BACI|nr:hypothetical protein [Gracilibacillus salinarum]UOQ85357.1 hypothetical protein MUN87_00160 [Gracilibacillus salinarum]